MKSKFLAVILAIISVVCCAVGLTACGGGKSGNNGTYYLYENGKFDKSKYIILDGSKWSDDDGVNGTYQLNGSTIVFYAEVSGSNEEMYSGTIENGALKISFMGATMTYYIEGSQPSGGSEDETPDETPKTEYTVTFDANGGTFADGKTTLTQNAQEGSTLTAPSSPARTASAFGGWATDKSGKTLWKFATDTVTKNLTLYAVWKEQSAAIISADGATIDEKQMSVFMLVDRNTESVSLANKIVCSSDSVWKLYYDKLGQTEIPTKIAAGKLGELMGGDNIFYIVVTSSSGLQVNVYELTVHRSHSVAVSFYDNKDNLINTDTFYTGYEYTVSYKPDIAGYTFNHWKYKNKSGEVTKFTSYEAVSLYADCTVKSYTAKLDVNGGNELQTAEQTVTYDKSYKFPVPTRTGYSFGGWYSGNTQVTNSDGSSLANWTFTGDRTLSAHWNINSYSVTATVNDNKAGSVKVYAVIGGKPSEDGKYNYNSKVTIEATTNDGYTFLGIFDKDDKKLNEDDKLFYVTTLGAAAESYTAKWIKVTLDKNISEAGSISSLDGKYLVGDEVTVTAETNAGYTFVGWYNGETELTKELSYTFEMPTEAVTYIAKFDVVLEMKNFNFTSTATTCTISKLKDKTVTEIVVPDYVTEIAFGAFSGCSSLESITLPFVGIGIGGSHTHFGYIFGAGNCYYNYKYVPASLKVVITGGETIGNEAFYKCSRLTSITILDSVTSIGYDAFRDCSGLTSITISDCVTSIGSWAFSGCDGLTSVYYKGTNNDWNNININGYNNPLMSAKRYYYSETEPIDEGNYWHYDSDGEVSVWELPSLEFTLCDDETYYIVSGIGTYKSSELVIPATYKNLPVKKVKATAFNGNQTITSVTIPNSIIEIGDVAFNCQNLNSVYASSLQDWLKIDFAYMSANPLYYAHNLYINNELVDSLSIPNDVTEIKDNAFTGFYGKTITIGNSVKTIGKCAFANCVKLTNLTIGSSVELINTSAFSDCKSLEEVTIPNSVKTIGYSVFAGCSNLSNIDFGTGVTEILSNAFNECALLQNLYIPSNIKFIGTFAFDSSGLYAVQFAVNSGWYITKDSSMTSGTDIALDDMTQNAIYLKTTYHDYYWKHN